MRDEMNDFLIFLMSLATMFVLFILIPIYSDKPSEPTKVCKDGKLYEVTHEGNITIYESAYRDCEEK